MPSELYDIRYEDINNLINKLIDSLVSIKDETGQFLMEIPGGRIIDTKGWMTGWEWTHGIGLYGMWHYHELTADKLVLNHIVDWFEAQMLGPEGTTSKNINTMAVFLPLAYVYERYNNEIYLPYLRSWADWAMYDLKKTKSGAFQHVTYLTDNHEQIWDDTLMMTVMPLAKIGLLLKIPEYIEEAKKQMLLHMIYLSDTNTGLWFHGYSFEGNHNFAKALWARGNSWITIVIPEFIELLDLKPGDFLREILIEALNVQVSKLAELQDAKTGLWHTLLNDTSSYLESSASAGFAYGILKGVRKRYLDKKYKKIGINAIKGVCNQISDSGELLNTSFGTGMGNNLQFYRDIPLTPMPYGQAMAIMALTEYLKLYL